MSSDDSMRGVEPASRNPGTGQACAYACASCAKRFGSLLGRRLRLVQGVRQWVCPRCAK